MDIFKYLNKVFHIESSKKIKFSTKQLIIANKIKKYKEKQI